MIDCVSFCRALSDETRQRILRLLVEEQVLCVGDIAEAFDVSQPTVSHHLGVLRQLGLVSRRRKGKQVFYSVNCDRIVECCGRLMGQFNEHKAGDT